MHARSATWQRLGMLAVGATFAAAALIACGEDESSGPAGTGATGATGTTTSSGGSGLAGTGGTGATGTGGSGASGTAGGSTYSCANPHPSWLYCEDFEAGNGDFDTWYAGSEFLSSPGSDDRGRIDLASDEVHGGSWSVYLPASEASGYRGASLDWYACDGASETNCPLRSFESLYMRLWVRFADDHRYVHHFLNLGGSQPDDFWYHGTAGCMPNGSLAMGTTVDHRRDSHESFFYTYFPGMGCDTNCGNYMDVAAVCQDCADKGLPTCDTQQQCCWGNLFEPSPAVAFPVGQWFCFEMMMQPNTVGQSDGQMAYWIDGQEIHRESSMMWRTSPTLAMNRARVQHYIETSDAQSHSNRVWFDDLVISTERIGCN